MPNNEVIKNFNTVVFLMEFEGFTVTDESRKNIKDILEGKRKCEDVISDIKKSFGLLVAL